MPMITVRYLDRKEAGDLRAAVAAAAADVSERTLGKARDVTAVLAEPADPASWFVGGSVVSDSPLAAFFLEITVTAGTNTKAETSAFVREMFERMETLLGPVDARSYVNVRAADGDGYGYGGRTQNSRWAEASR